jgi:hypothetical protein
MAKFEITAWHPAQHIEKKMFYDSSLSTLTWEDGSNIIQDVKSAYLELSKKNEEKNK